VEAEVGSRQQKPHPINVYYNQLCFRLMWYTNELKNVASPYL
jgi:hypothetical protein